MTVAIDALVDWLLCQRQVRILAPLVHTRATFFYTNYVTWSGTQITYRLRLTDAAEEGSKIVPVVEPIAFDPQEDPGGHLEVMTGRITACAIKHCRQVNEDLTLSSRFMSLSILHEDLEIAFRASGDHPAMIQIAISKIESI